jgi:hypothetical protein
MENIIRNVRDIETGERQVLEHVIGKHLEEDQQVIFQVVTLKDASNVHALTRSGLPEWCNVFSGLSEEQIVEVEDVIRQRSDLARPSE